MSGRTISLLFCNTRLTPSCLPAAGKKLSSLLFLALPLLLISLSLFLFLSPQSASAQSIITVDDNGTANHTSIQNAIDAATSGDTIQVEAGNYGGSSSISIDVGILLLGPNAGVSGNDDSRTDEAVISINNPAGPAIRIETAEPVTIDGFTFDGTGTPIDSYVTGNSPTIQNNVFNNTNNLFFANSADFVFKNNYLTNIVSPSGEGVQLAGNWDATTETGTSVTIQNNVWEDYPSSGINLSNVRGDVSDNAFSNIAYFGILIANSPGDLTVTDNTFDGITNPDPEGVSTWGAGIRFWDPAEGGPVTITGNTFSNSYNGIAVRPDNSIADLDIEIGSNKFSNNVANIRNEGSGAMNVANNYWGTAVEATIDAKIAGDGKELVTFKPYYIDAALTTESSDDQVVVDDEEVEVTPEQSVVVIPEDTSGITEVQVTVPSTVTDATINVAPLITSLEDTKEATLAITLNINATTSTGQVLVNIPTGITISADDSWDGTINVPTVKPTNSVTVTPSGDNVEVDEVLTVIEIGFGDVALEFDKGVRLVLDGMAGNLVGYSRAGTFTQITSVCAADSQAVGDALPDAGDCKIDAGDDLVVWTKHFTSFVVYSEAPVATDEDDDDDAPSGGGGGGGSRTVVITWPGVDTLPASHFINFPLDRIQVASSAFVNAGGVSINQAVVNQQVSISGEFTNFQGTPQSYAFIVQVTNEAGFVTDIAWQQGVLDAGSTADVSTLWTPETDGTFTVKIFVWNGISAAPEPLSEVTVKNISVS